MSITRISITKKNGLNDPLPDLVLAPPDSPPQALGAS
jgi:hypothetical protein